MYKRLNDEDEAQRKSRLQKEERESKFSIGFPEVTVEQIILPDTIIGEKKSVAPIEDFKINERFIKKPKKGKK